jgi:hypothetical protein
MQHLEERANEEALPRSRSFVVAYELAWLHNAATFASLT